MIAIITKTILHREIQPNRQIFSSAVIMKSLLKLKSGLGVVIGGLASGKLTKLYVTSLGGAGRMAWLLRGDRALLLLARGKNDPIRENITFKNQDFVAAVVSRLASVEADILSGDFQEIEV